MSTQAHSFVAPQTLRDVPRSEYGDIPAIIIPATDAEQTHTLTYASLCRNVELLARQLKALLPEDGKEEHVVALAMINTLAFPLGFLATAWAGAATAPLNPDYKQDEFAFYLEDNVAEILLVSPDGNANAQAAAEGLQIPIYEVGFDVAAQTVTLTRVSAYGPEVTEGSKLDPISDERPPTDKPVMYMHTSGTTSRPKRVRLTHGNLATSLKNIHNTYELSPDDRTLLVMPLFHVHGLIAGLLTSLASGAGVIIHGRFAASKFWNHVVEYQATWYTAVPTIHQILLMRAEKDYPNDKRPHLRFIRSCSASLASSVLERLESTFHAPVLEAYAMTENAHQMTSNPLPKHGPRKPGSVGKATGIEVAILDDDCNILPTGKIGEVCIKGASVTPGYVNNPSANEAGFKGGWFHTGDQGKLDEEGYLELTGRIKELIIRGGEKISPLEVDAVLLSHPHVAEAVSFAAPDPKYGEEVAAVVTAKEGTTLTEQEVIAHCKTQLSDFKVPKKLFIATQVPRTATGKIQRRIVAEHFLSDSNGPSSKPPAQQSSTTAATSSCSSSCAPSSGVTDGYALTARALYAAGVRYMFGVVGIPVTKLGPSAQEAGIRFISFRNEQAASYAASAVGYLTGHPGALLTVSGPGVVHGLAGLANAKVNTWPMVMLSGSTATPNVGRGGFQELDQLSAAAPHAKAAIRASKALDVPAVIAEAVQTSLTGRPGGVYVDLPCDVLHAKIDPTDEAKCLDLVKSRAAQFNSSLQDPPEGLSSAEIANAVNILAGAKKPLLVVGKGAAYAKAEDELRSLVTATNVPFLPTPMGKGVISDDHPLNASAARSMVLKDADVVLVVGARLNWVLHFGDAPRWNKDAVFILVDVAHDQSPSPTRVHVKGHAKTAVKALQDGLREKGFKVDMQGEWVGAIRAKVEKNSKSLAAKLSKVASPMDYHTAYNVILNRLKAVQGPSPIIVSEGANTMDIGRSLLPISEPRTRLDAGTWGTMGVGLGYAIAAAVTNPERLVVAIEGDSAFGFSGMEVETLCRYGLRVVVLVFNNNGIYGGKFECGPESAYPKDPTPTAFVNDARYEKLAEAFGGKGYFVQTPEELDHALAEAFTHHGPSVVNIDIDPLCGTESGSLQDHN